MEAPKRSQGWNGKDALGYRRLGLSPQSAQRENCPAQSQARTRLALRPHGALSPEQTCPSSESLGYPISAGSRRSSRPAVAIASLYWV